MKNAISLLVITTLTWSSSSWGYPVYDFNPTNLKKKFPVYDREIKHQLSNIVSDFLFVVTKFGNLTEKMVEIYGEINQINLLIQELLPLCPIPKANALPSEYANPTCDQLITSTYQKLTAIEIRVLESLNLLQKKDPPRILTNQQVNTKIELMSLLTGIQGKLYRLVHIFEFFIFSNYTNFSFLQSRKEVPQIIQEIQDNAEFMIVVAIDEKFRESFDQLWNLYIHPINQILALKSEQGFDRLIASLESLNMVWNNFHMNLSKGHLDLPEKTPQLILLIHNRWNNILKSLL